ncbi:helix-turn-helix domain-containing protein, partial [Actinomadura rugatobispora]
MSESPPDITGPPLGELLRGWRERALLTQEQLAERSGLNVRTVRRLENNEFQPRVTSMLLLAEALALDGAQRALLAAVAHGRPAGRDEPAVTVPRQLPADIAAFVGRERELAALEARHGTYAADVFAIDGMPGAGKTALAVRAAHRLAPRFPDGRLFMDLHGHTEGTAPVEPGEALARMLRALGVPGEHIPGHTDDRAALYRGVLADRRVLVVLDDATDEQQVRPLLPAGPGCRVIVTSRRRLTGLDDTRTLSLDVLPPAQAVALFSRAARVPDTPAVAE